MIIKFFDFEIDYLKAISFRILLFSIKKKKSKKRKKVERFAA
jgi:hypothetical protein